MSWGFIWLMLVLKIPLVALIWLVWWAVKQEPEPASESRDDDGGVKPLHQHHPRRPLPRHPRRGPHGDPALPPPPRIRTVQARARTYGH